ncbi:carbohydrate kinase [Streptomyces armeniacus]|uniref:Carbohydrate kinase n=1 Tax=Streptomyces armeniacus TaxID=83291 RepID=A0A345XQU4_9ACTN|nr:FGGY family carbohydrate kinase [Streptomyces armeniacus]AXK34010.1 carbohydrate kinase [Streptomyces armeniacus]
MTDPDVSVGIDLGTQSVRAVAADRAGRVLGRGAAPLDSTRRGVRHTQSPAQWWQATAAACRQALAPVPPARVCAVAVDATSGTVLLAGPRGEPLTDALMYDDQRAAAEAAAVNTAGADTWRRLGYTRMGDQWALPKLLWLLRHEPGAAYASGAVLTHQNDHVNRRLTGHPVPADSSHALKSGLDLQADDWPWDVFKTLGIPETLLPPVVRPGTELGRVCAAAAAETGLPEGTAVVAGMTDGCAAQLGADATRTGDVNAVLGTTLVVKGVSERLPRDASGMLYAHRAAGGGWLPGGASNAGGRVLNAAFPGGDFTHLDARAAEHGPAGAVAYPLSGEGERFPFAAPRAHALLLGSPSGEAERYRVLLEGVAFVERLALDCLDLHGVPTDGTYTLSGGGASSAVWCQVRADVLGRPVRVTEQAGSAFGMAVLAGAYGGFAAGFAAGGGSGGAPCSPYAARLAATSRAMVRVRDTYAPRGEDHVRMLASYRRLVAELHDRGWLPTALADHATHRSAT